jgi:AsmA protein
VTLLRGQNGTWNYSSIGQEGKRKAPNADTESLLPNLSVGKLRIADGTVTVASVPQTAAPQTSASQTSAPQTAAPQTAAPRVYTNLTLSAKNFSFTRQFSFTINAKLPEGGSLKIQATAGPINQHDASLTPVSAKLVLKQANLVGAGLVEPRQGISGVADLDATLLSNGQTAQADGTLHVTQLKLARNGSPSTQPVEVRFSIQQDLQSLSGTVKSATVQLGHATLAVNGTYQTRGTATTLHMTSIGSNMPVDALVAFLPSLGVQLPAGSRLQGGTMTANLSLSGPTTGVVLSGPVRIANTRLAGFDLGQKLAAIRSLTGTKTGSDTTIQTLSTDLRYGPDGTRMDHLLAVVPGLGSASGQGSISPAGALNYHLLVKLASGGVGGLATQAMGLLPGMFGGAVTQTTRNGIPVTIAGTTSSPTFTPDLGGMITGAGQRKGAAQSNPLGGVLGGLIHH